jgi:DNA/RNA endonuclease YhcR with UshA esterase domain
MRKSAFSLSVVVALLAISMNAVYAADATKSEVKTGSAGETKVIKPAEAKNHLDQQVTVEFIVQAASAPAGKGIAFLNAEKNRKSANNFTAFISGKGLKKFKAEGKIENPAVHFYHKKVQVTGKLVMFKEQPEIVIDSPDQIKVVEEELDGGKREKSSSVK